MRRIFLALIVVILTAAPAMAQDLTREQVEQIVREYIRNNPGDIIDSVENWGRRQQETQEKEMLVEVKKNESWLYNNKDHAEAGNPKGTITMIEFFDYNCGYCKQALGDVMTLIEKNKDLRVVFIEIPILGETSTLAARWALAAKKQDMYLEYHIALMRHKGQFNQEILTDYADKAGLDVKKLKKDIDDPKLDSILNENLTKSASMGITGTPAFIIGDQIIRGYAGMEGFEEALTKARAQ